MIAVIPHAGAMMLLAGLFFLTGVLLERCVHTVRAATRETMVLRIAAGMVCWMALAFALAAIGHLRLVPVSLAAVAVVGVTAGLLWATRRRPAQPNPAVDHMRVERGAASRPMVWTALLIVPGVVLGAIFVNQLYPSVVADDAVYHLTLPRLYVEAGGFRDVPLSLFALWPQNIELLYALAMIWQDFILAKLVSWLFLVLLVVALVKFGATQASGLVASIAVCLLLANHTVLFEANTAYVDLTIGFWGFLAFAFIWDYLDRPTSTALFAAGICSGIAAGSKLSGTFIGVSLAAVLAADLMPRSGGWRIWLRATVILAAVTVLVASPWYIRGVLLTGSPAFPMGYGRLPVTSESWPWSAALNDQFWQWQSRIGMGRGWRDYLLLPYRVIIDARPGSFDTFDGRLNPLWIVLLPLALFVAAFDRGVRRAVVFTVTFCVLWAITSQQIRLLLPALPQAAFASSAAIAWSLHRALTRLRPAATTAAGSSRYAVPWAFAVLLAIAFQTGLLYVGRYTLQGGGLLARRFIAGPPVTLAEAIDPVFDFLNQNLPAGSRVMMLNFNDTFFLNHEFLVDSTPYASQVAGLLSHDPSVEGIGRTLQSLGVTHIVLNDRPWGVRYPDALLDFVRDEARARIVYFTQDDTFTVLELKHGSP